MSLHRFVSEVQLPPRKPHPWPELNILKELDKTYIDKNLEEADEVVGLLYAQYVRCVKKLDELWHLEQQPQKLLALGKIIEAATLRLLELKDNLAQINISEYHYVDGAIIMLKLVPKDFEIMHLNSLPHPRDRILQTKIDALIKQGTPIYIPPPPPTPPPEEADGPRGSKDGAGNEDDIPTKRRKRASADEEEAVVSARPVVLPPDPKVVALRNAINLIQKHERARQFRLEFLDLKQVFNIKKRRTRVVKIPEEIGEKAALQIQKLYRGYLSRKYIKEREEQRRFIIGMYVPYWTPHHEHDKLPEIDRMRKDKREKKLQEYLDTVEKERERVVRMVAPGLGEDLQDEIRYWFRDWYDKVQQFDVYPSEEEGGTVLVIRGETMTPDEWIEKKEESKKLAQQLKDNPQLAKKMKEEKEKARKMEKERIKKEKEKKKKEAKAAKLAEKRGATEPRIHKLKESPYLAMMEEAENNYTGHWHPLWDLEKNPERQIVMDEITDHFCYELQLDVRREIDVLMRLELILLEKALAADRKKKYKKPKKKKKKKKKKKGGKKGKNPYDNCNLDCLFQELYDRGLIVKYPEVTFNDFFGDYAYSNAELRPKPGPPLDPRPAVLDARQLVVNTCVLPLGAPGYLEKVKTVAIVGPPLSGKKILVNAIANETNAVMFDISPEKIANSTYNVEDKKERKLFIQLLQKMTKVLEPSIVFINGAEKPFYKKVPKPERLFKPKLLKKLIKPLVKKITPEDKVMVIATSNAPQKAKGKPFRKTYEKVIMLPRTDYGTMFMALTKLLMRYKEVPRNLDLSALTKMCMGYPLPQIKEIIESVLSPRRIVQLRYKPFRNEEVVEHLASGKVAEPFSQKDEDKLFEWYNKNIPIGKRKTKLVKEQEEHRLMLLAQEEKQAKKKRPK